MALTLVFAPYTLNGKRRPQKKINSTMYVKLYWWIVLSLFVTLIGF